MQKFIDINYVYSTYLNKIKLDKKETCKDVFENKVILKDKIDEKYKFYKKSFLFKICSFLFYLFAFIVLYPFNSFYYRVKVKGKRNLKNIKTAIFISNHTFMLDCAVLSTHVLKFQRPNFLVMKTTFQMPIVKTIVKLLGGEAIPENNLVAYKNFLTKTDNQIKGGKSLLVYPEGSLWPYFADIRPLNSGAFRFSIKNGVPVVPFVISFRTPSKISRFFGRKKPYININILEPIYPNDKVIYKIEEERINETCFGNMKKVFKENNEYIYIDETIKGKRE